MNKNIVIFGVIGLLLSACDRGGGDSTNNSVNSDNSDNSDNSVNGDNINNGGFIVDGDGNTVVVETDDEPQGRNLIKELQSRVEGTFLILPHVNSVQPINEQGEGFQWIVENIENIENIEAIDFSDIEAYLTPPSTDVFLEMAFVQRQGFADVIAVSTTFEVLSSNDGSPIVSENLIWFYGDLDQDGFFDVEELGVRPVDCDGDLLAAYQDSDSDNDGIIDSRDSTPHGPPCI